MIASFPFFWWIIIFAFWVIFLTLTMTIARSKGHSPLLWGLLAVFLPLITVIIVLVLPDRTRAVQ
jgi:Na+-translocating ferredoxin:NAD+ oxidoreductase RnfA subunit